MDKKIVFMTANTGGGIIQFTVQLYHSLVKLGYSVKVCVPYEARESNISEIPENDLLMYKKQKKVLNNAPYIALAQKIADVSPDSVWYCDDSVVCAKTGIALRRFGIDQVLTVHDAGGYHPTNRITLRSRLMRVYVKLLNVRWYESISKFVLLSPESEKTFKSRFKKEREKTVSMNLGAHIPHVPEAMPPEIEALKNESYLLFFGRIDKYKGIEKLLAAYNRSSDRALPIIIAGSGSLTAREMELAAANPKTVLINRFISDGEMKWLFAHSAAVLLPYIEATQSGVIPIAYAYGKPVVVSDIPGLTQFVDNGKTGTVCRDEEEWIKAIEFYSGKTPDDMVSHISHYYNEHMDWENNLMRILEKL